MDKTSNWYSSFLLVPQPNGKVRLCLDPARLRPVHRGPTTNDIFLKLTCTHYLTLRDAGAGYQNLKLDERSSYLTIFTYSVE